MIRSAAMVALVMSFAACLKAQGPAALDGLERGLQHRIARSLLPSIREDERVVNELRSRLDRLPPLAPGSRGASAGYHSRFYDVANRKIDIVLDLGETQSIDRVAIFSVSTVFRGDNIAAYGFPRRFLIEASEVRSFNESRTVFDSQNAASVVRPKFPVQFETPKLRARFLRLRVLEHWQRGDGKYLTALGEIMVISGGRNIAIGAKVRAESFVSLPDWSEDNLVDGQTDLGLAISPEPSVSNGFLSTSQATPKAKKWIQLQLAKSALIDEVRLVPATPFDAPSQHGHGFPRRFRVVASTTADFSSPQVIADRTVIAFPNPGNNPVILPTGGVAADFIRIEAQELWHVSQRAYSLALAEVQVYEDGQNIARNAKVTASDVFQTVPYDRVWKPRFLVDGFSSQNRLIEIDQWLEGLQDREETEREIRLIEARVLKQVEATTNTLLFLAAGSIATLAGLTGMTLVRRKRALAQQRDQMRARIARDLHDDLGSRLGGMRLISENMLAHQELPSSMQEDLSLIHRASSEASDAMRDIVWLLDNSESSRSKLVGHIRHITPAILGGIDCEFSADGVPEQELEFDFRRQVLFAFKECLGNAAKHSDAKHVHCHVGGDVMRFQFEVCDDGKGFRVQEVGGGHGLDNLRSRAKALGGSVSVQSRPGEGTRIVFDVPVRVGKRK